MRYVQHWAVRCWGELLVLIWHHTHGSFHQLSLHRVFHSWHRSATPGTFMCALLIPLLAELALSVIHRFELQSCHKSQESEAECKRSPHLLSPSWTWKTASAHCRTWLPFLFAIFCTCFPPSNSPWGMPGGSFAWFLLCSRLHCSLALVHCCKDCQTLQLPPRPVLSPWRSNLNGSVDCMWGGDKRSPNWVGWPRQFPRDWSRVVCTRTEALQRYGTSLLRLWQSWKRWDPTGTWEQRGNKNPNSVNKVGLKEQLQSGNTT